MKTPSPDYKDQILQSIGNTPMVRINKLNPNPNATILAKLEGFNPTGSIKDRIALAMVEQAVELSRAALLRIRDLTAGKPKPDAFLTGMLGQLDAVKAAALEQVKAQAKAAAAPTPKEALGEARWIWYPEGDPATAVPPGARSFRRVFTLAEGRKIASARLLMHAEEAFNAWLNGRKAGEGHNFHRNEDADITGLLKPGANTLIVEAVNRGDKPSPAGLIGRIILRYEDGTGQDISTDGTWSCAATGLEAGRSDVPAGTRWTAARDVGPLGMAPWGEWTPTYGEADVIADDGVVAEVMKDLGQRPDFDYKTAGGDRSLRYIHRSSPEAEIYFVANKRPRVERAVLSFRTTGRRPEIWRPDTGRLEKPAVFEEADGMLRLPLTFEPSGSAFIIFREKAGRTNRRLASVKRDGRTVLSAAEAAEDPDMAATEEAKGVVMIRSARGGRFELAWADGRTETVELPAPPAPLEISGPWRIRFPSGGGAPESAELAKLVSWSDHPDKGIAYFSGQASYHKSFDLPADRMAAGRRLVLDLGDVQVMAAVRLNGRDLGILWKPPYRVDVTEAARPGGNELEIRVANLPINRQIGDESLAEDSRRNPDGTLQEWPDWLLAGKPSPSGRFTFSSWRLWKKGEALQPSGLLGPVVVTAASVFKIGR